MCEATPRHCHQMALAHHAPTRREDGMSVARGATLIPPVFRLLPHRLARRAENLRGRFRG
jgi:hypothetical protein